MFKRLLFQFLIAIIALGIAIKFFPDVQFQGSLEIFLTCSATLGLINSLIKPLLKKFFFPLRLLTLGLFNLIINIGILWVVDYLFSELTFASVQPLFLTSSIIAILNLLVKPFD